MSKISDHFPLEFIYTIIDPLISEFFDIYAIDFHEDRSVSYDYVVAYTTI